MPYQESIYTNKVFTNYSHQIFGSHWYSYSWTALWQPQIVKFWWFENSHLQMSPFSRSLPVWRLHRWWWSGYGRGLWWNEIPTSHEQELHSLDSRCRRNTKTEQGRASCKVSQPYLLTYMGVFGFKVCLTWCLRYWKFIKFILCSRYFHKNFSPVGVTRVGFKLIRPVVCLESEFKDCNLA